MTPGTMKWKTMVFLALQSFLASVLEENVMSGFTTSFTTGQTEGDQVYYYDYNESSVSGVEPTFDVPIINVTVVEGQSAVLPCSVDGMTNQMIIWLAPNNAPITFENTRVFDDTRFNIIQNNNNHKEWNLHIADIRYEDRGTFKCTINTIPVKHKMVILHVQVPPKVVEDSTTKDLVVMEGTEAEVVCNITGVPPPTITWFVVYTYAKNRNRIELDAVGNSIRITNTSRLLDAVYECVGENGIPPPISKKISLTIEFRPKVSITNPRLGQMLGKETMLDCIVEANPQATITWYKDKNKVVSSSRTKLDPYEDLAYRMILSLRISGIEPGDYGRYECEALNPLGSSTGHMELYEYKPMMKTSLSITSTQAITVLRKNKAPPRKNTTRHNNHNNKDPSPIHINKDLYNYNQHKNGYFGNPNASNQLPHQQTRTNIWTYDGEDGNKNGLLDRIALFYGNSVSGTEMIRSRLVTIISLHCLCKKVLQALLTH